MSWLLQNDNNVISFWVTLQISSLVLGYIRSEISFSPDMPLVINGYNQSSLPICWCKPRLMSLHACQNLNSETLHYSTTEACFLLSMEVQDAMFNLWDNSIQHILLLRCYKPSMTITSCHILFCKTQRHKHIARLYLEPLKHALLVDTILNEVCHHSYAFFSKLRGIRKLHSPLLWNSRWHLVCRLVAYIPAHHSIQLLLTSHFVMVFFYLQCISLTMCSHMRS